MPNDVLEKVLAFDGDTCVHASAGTGKTFILVNKYVRLLMKKEGDRYHGLENLVAITFTEKAADEMRVRISKRLLEEIRALESGAPEKGRVRLLRHLNGCRRRITQAYISTIHSFCARVLREYPVEAGIDPLFEIMDAQRSGAVMEKALEQFLLMKLRKKDADVNDLVYRYGFASDFEYESSLTKLVSTLFPLIRAAGIGSDGLLSEYEDFLQGFAGTLKDAGQRAQKYFDKLKELVKSEKAVRMAEEIANGLKKLSPKNDMRPENGASAARIANRLASLIKKNILPKNAYAAADGLKGALGDYAGAVVSSLAFIAAKKLKKLIGEFFLYLELNVKRRALLDFDDLQELTLNLFRRNPAIRNHYRELFRCVMVDEFQDVNGIQKKIISQLAEPQPNEKGVGKGEEERRAKLFIVGDPKQAIYGFRGGDVEVFEEVQKDILKAGGKLFHLRKNMRSTPELVDFANAYFAANCGRIFGNEDKCGAKRNKGGRPAVENITFNAADSSMDEARFREAHIIAHRINEIVGNAAIAVYENGEKRAPKHLDVVILFRKFTQLPIYESVLNDASIPNMVYRGVGFYQSQEVADLLSVLSFIEDPSDTAAWVGAMRSPYAGCSDETILSLRRGAKGRLIACSEYADVKTAAGKVGDPLEREKFAYFTGYTGLIRKMKDRMAISETIEAVLEQSGIIGILGAQPNGLQKVGNVQKLIETARSMQRSGVASLKNFVRTAAKMLETNHAEPQALTSVPGRDAVKIMTIHQSKGQEFPIVLLADINSGGREIYSPAIFNQRRGLAVKHVDIPTLRSYGGTVFGNISSLNAQKEEDDEMRLFYVACTRARDRLVFSGFNKKGRKSERTRNLQKLMERLPALFDDTKAAASRDEAFAHTSSDSADSAYDALVGGVPGLENGFSKDAQSVPAELMPAAHNEMGGVETGDVVLSVGRLTTYLRCPYEYMLRHLHGLTPPGETRYRGFPSASTTALGTAVHGILEGLDFETGAGDFKKSLALTVRERMAGFDGRHLAEVRKRLEGLYKTGLFGLLRSGALKEVGREIPFTSKHTWKGNTFYIKGRVDMLMRKGEGSALVIDYKYSSAERVDDAARFQLELYASAMAMRLGIKEISCAVAYLKNDPPRVFEWNITQKRLSAIEEKVLKTAHEIAVLEKMERPPYGVFKVEKCNRRSCGFAGFCLGD
ncbi:MAG: UvrD-helicase domain-containing protein [Nitrospinota bacterium]